MRILNRNVNNSTRASSSDDERFRLWLVWFLGGEIVVHLLILAVTGLVVRLAEGRERSAGEQDNPFELLVEEEIVEAPQRPVLPEGVRSKVGVVRVDVAVNQVDLLVECDPELVVDVRKEGAGRHAHQVVHIARHKLQTRFFGKLVGLGVGEVVVREGGVERGDEVEQRLPGDSVAEDPHTLVLRPGAPGERPAVRRSREGVTSVPVCGRGQGLYGLGVPPSGELLVLLFLGADHFARITLDPANNFGVSCFQAEQIVDGFDARILKQLHDDGL